MFSHSLIALLAAAAYVNAASMPKLATRAASSTFDITTHYTADGITELVASVKDPCSRSPISLSDTCNISFECSGAFVPDAATSLATHLQSSIANTKEARSLDLIQRDCVCTCGTYCCIFCSSATAVSVPESVEVEATGAKRSVGSVTAKFSCGV